MASKPPPPPPPPPRDGDKAGPSLRKESSGWSRYAVWILLGSVLAIVLVTALLPSDSRESVDYSDFLDRVTDGEVTEAQYDNTDGGIKFSTETTEFQTVGPTPLPDDDDALISARTTLKFTTPQPSFLTSILPLLLPVGLLILFFVWMQRRAQGQMGGIMSIGRSKAKTYSTERPGTTFDDVVAHSIADQLDGG